MNRITLVSEAISGTVYPSMCLFEFMGNVISSSTIQVYLFQTNVVFNDNLEDDLFSVMSPIFV